MAIPALVGAGLILLRLLANMLDGMVADESGEGGPLGSLYNEIPDRISLTDPREQTAGWYGLFMVMPVYIVGWILLNPYPP